MSVAREQKMVTETATRFTYRDYLHLPDNGKRYQIIEGELYMVPAPVPYHQKISGNLSFVLRKFVEEKKLGEVYCAPCDFVLSKTDIVQPDIFFISKERLTIIGKKYITAAPDLVIEILSPYTEKIDLLLKRKLYAEYGVKEYWIVDPEEKTVELFVLEEEMFITQGKFQLGEKLESKLLRGLIIDIDEIF